MRGQTARRADRKCPRNRGSAARRTVARSTQDRLPVGRRSARFGAGRKRSAKLGGDSAMRQHGCQIPAIHDAARSNRRGEGRDLLCQIKR